MGRPADRAEMNEATRLRLLEVDADKQESDFGGFRDEVLERFDGITKLLIGILVALMTTSVGIALTLILTAGNK